MIFLVRWFGVFFLKLNICLMTAFAVFFFDDNKLVSSVYPVGNV